jgi:hypothetical protein
VRKRLTLTATGLVAVGILVLSGVAGAGVSGPFTIGSVNVGSINTTQGTPLTQINLRNEVPQGDEADAEIKVGGSIKQFHGKPVGVPTPDGQTVSSASGGATGFTGIDHFDERTADGGNQFSLEPPDQALCVGNGYVVEGVNLAFNVYDTSGTKLQGPIAYNPFFTQDHAATRDASGAIIAQGWFLSDPKCYYDSDTGRFFMTILGEEPTLTAGIQRTAQFIAVSKTGDPTGDWWIYHFDTTDDGQNGTVNNPGCSDDGCLGDQPLIGADKYGFYVTTNEFPFSGGFNGSQIYATSKTALENGTPGALVHFVTHGLQEGPAYSVQPATAPNGQYDTGNGGTEYFLSALEFNGTLDDRIAAWTLTNTSSLDSASPNLKLQSAVMKSESYGAPPPVEQKPGDNPLGQLIGDPQGTIQSNDDRMNQVVYANGLLWSGVNTVVQTKDGSTRVGVAWFAVDANGKANGRLSAHVKQQGYVSVDGNNVFYPAIGVNAAGKAVMAFTLAGPGYFPSAAWLNLTGGDGQIHVSGAGLGPDDGFTQYPDEDPVDNGSGRWGDYGAAVAGPDGSIWLASEYIGQTCTLAQFEQDTTCGSTRTILANWGTFITHLQP